MIPNQVASAWRFSRQVHRSDCSAGRIMRRVVAVVQRYPNALHAASQVTRERATDWAGLHSPRRWKSPRSSIVLP